MVKQKRLLLTGVFGPYGVKDGYAEARGMQMELANNQITREQGVHSPRANYFSYGLYLMAENISIPSTVLDFPKWKDFTKELKKGYTHVGISFIVANVYKAKRMAEYIREHHPGIKIILGGFGTVIPNIRQIVPCDEICHGEGVSWLREYFGEDPDRPIRNPIMVSTLNKYVYGLKIKDDVMSIFPGLGCRNGCAFCITSHKFKKRYIPFLRTGAEIFELFQEGEKERGFQEIGIVDENFLKEPERARQLLAQMEKHNKAYRIGIFSSAEIITELGIDFLDRLGVVAVWIGAESKKKIFNKTKEVDLKRLISELQSRGISVVASTILFLEHHNKKTLMEDIDWAIDLGADLHQFTNLSVFPGAPLYEKYAKEGKLIEDFPWTRIHGMDELNFKHPHFKPGDAVKIIDYAFRKKFEKNGPSVLNMAITLAQGYKKAKDDFQRRKKAGLCWNPKTLKYEKKKNPKPDNFMKLRIELLRQGALSFRPMLLASKVFAPNDASRVKSDKAIALYNELFGKPTLKEKALSTVLILFTAVEAARINVRKLFGKGDLIHQPPTKRTEFNSNTEEYRNVRKWIVSREQSRSL